MDSSMNFALPDTQDLAMARSTRVQPTLALASDDLRDSSPGAQQNTEQVQHALDGLKRAAALKGVHLKESDMRIRRNVIIVDDRLRRT